MEKTYFDERRLDTENKIKQLLFELPEFAEDFFIGIETTTSPLTRLGYARDLLIFFDYLYTNSRNFYGLNKDTFTLKHLNKVEAFDIEKFISYLTHYVYNGKAYTNSLPAKSRKLASIRSFFKYMYNKDLIDGNVASKVDMPKLHEKPIIRLEQQEVFDMLEIAENGTSLSPKQKVYHELNRLRDIAILSLFLGTGIRISELVGINIDDIDFYTNSFKVTRKGGNQSILYFNDDVSIALLEYYEKRQELKAVEKDEKAFFLSMQNKRISVRSVELLVKKYAKIVSPLKHITPHKLRSTFGTNLYRTTKDIYVVAELLGHKDVNVTKKHYADISEEIKKEASKQVSIRENPSKFDD